MPVRSPSQKSAKDKTRTIPQLKVVVVASIACEEGKDYIVSSPESVHELPMIRELMSAADRETFVCLHLSTKNHLISWEIISVGSLNEGIVHPRELFKGAILANAAAVVLVHNHPSGDPQPSRADVELTRRLVRAGDAIGIEILDHIVFGKDCCVSMKDLNIV